jgi:phi LC3 family holin
MNWKVRLKNKTFWLAFIPALLVLVQVVMALFDVRIEIDELNGKLMDVVNAVFVLLALLGVVNDPTTAGLSDSAQAMTYETPKEG